MDRGYDNKVTNERENENIGVVQIADDVVAMIASLAAMEINGVASLVGNMSNELMQKVGVKNLTKGVKVDLYGRNVKVDLTLKMEYGFNIPSTCGKVQEKVKSAIENMTGLKVVDVNVRIAGINMPKAK